MGVDVPEAAGVRGDLVGQDDGAVGQAAEFQLKVDELDAHLAQVFGEDIVDLQRVGGDGLQLLGGAKLHGEDVVIVDHRVAQVVVFVAVFQHGAGHFGAFGQAQALGEGAGGHIADDDLQRHDAHLLHQGLPVGKLPDEVGGDAFCFQHLHQEVAHLVVDDALALDGAFFQAVKGGGIVFVVHDVALGVAGFVNLFGFAFIELFELFHVVFDLLHTSALPWGRRFLFLFLFLFFIYYGIL